MSKSTGINRVLTLELARVTERAAVAAAPGPGGVGGEPARDVGRRGGARGRADLR